MNVLLPAPRQHESRSRGHARAALIAFLAIVSRDLLITRREAPSFLLQTLVQPLFFLFVFGKVLSTTGAATSGFALLLLPGIVAFTLFLTALQGTSIDLSRDLGFTREIEDRLLAPLPIALVAIEKIVLASLRGLLAGAVVFPLAYWILGSAYQVRTDHLGALIGLMVLIALTGAALGLLVSVVMPIQQLPLIFALVLTPLTFTGCTFYTWTSLNAIRWFQIMTLFNPLTYAAEGMRYAMVPPLHGQALSTLAPGIVLLVLGASFVLCLWMGIRLFKRRVVI